MTLDQYQLMNDFIIENLNPQKLLGELRNWSSELEATLALCLQSSQYENLIIQFNTKLFKDLSITEKVLFYKLFRVLYIFYKEENWYLRLIFEDFCALLYKRSVIYNNRELEYLEHITDQEFLYRTETQLLWNRSKRTNFFRILKNKNSRTKKSLLQILQNPKELLVLNKIKYKTPKRPERHKGYRDHGSLGSEYSQTLRQQSDEVFKNYKKLHQQDIERKCQEHQFLRGLDGFV